MAKIEVTNPTDHSVDVGEPPLLEPRTARKVDDSEHVQALLEAAELALVPKPEPKKPAAKAADTEGGS